jgi:hypothetical protein
MTEQDWKIVLQVFQASRSRGGKEQIFGFKSEAETLDWIGSEASQKWIKLRLSKLIQRSLFEP